MKKYVNLLSLLTITTALGYFSFSDGGSSEKITASVRKAPFSSFALGTAKPVELHWGGASNQYSTAREKKDQVLDWMLMALVSDAGLNSGEMSKVLFDLPPVRFGYVQPVATFEYGPTRSRSIGDGKIVVLLPAGVSIAEQDDELATIADEHRKNSGKLPQTLLPFTYTYDAETEEATVTRQEPIAAQRFFTKEMGYFEANVESKADLNDFLRQVDDLTFASYGSAHLKLGGRRLKSGYKGVTLEDVAALWQTQNKIQQNLGEIKAFDQRWQETRFYESERTRMQAQYKRERKELETRLKPVNGAGFSLDPTYDFQGLAQFFNKAVGNKPSLSSLSAPHLWNSSNINLDEIHKTLEAIRTQRLPGEIPGVSSTSQEPTVDKPTEIREALANGEIGPFMDWYTDKLRQSMTPAGRQLSPEKQEQILGILWSRFAAPYAFQAARYDGDLQGTEAAMTLFYTDLAAKLKALELWNRSDVSGFRSLTQVKVSPVYKSEVELLSNTRLWFGPLNRGFQIVDNDLIFTHNTTRIYAASSQTLTPGKEAEPNAESASFLGWWNDHYDEVARYEPQYQRLNEIMKWSLVVSWLAEKQMADQLSMLADVKPQRDNWFPEWVKKHPELRFGEWRQIPFYPRGYKGSKTEALALLRSASYSNFGSRHWLEGGVSLGDAELIGQHAQLPEAFKAEELNLRAGLDFSNSEQGNILRTLDKTVYQFTNEHEIASVSSLAKADSKFRTPVAEMRQAPLQRFYVKGTERFTVDVNFGGSRVGDYFAEVSADSPLKIGFRNLDVAQGQNLAEEISRLARNDQAIDAAIFSRAEVESAIRLGCNNCFAIKLKGSSGWMKVAPESSPSVTIQNGWEARTAALDDGRVFNMKWVNREDLVHELKQSQYIEINNPKFPANAELPRISNRGPPLDARDVTLTLADKVIKAKEVGGKIYLEASGFGPTDLDLIADIAKKGKFSNSPAIQALQNGDFRSVARRIAADPIQAKQDVAHFIAKISEGRPSVGELDAAIHLNGDLPELVLKRAAAELDESRITNAIEDIRKYVKGKPLSDLEAKLGREYAADRRVAPLFRMLRFQQDAAAQGLRGEVMPVVNAGEMDFHFRLMDEVSSNATTPFRTGANAEPYYLLRPSSIGHSAMLDPVVPLKAVRVTNAKIAPRLWPKAIELPSGKKFYLSEAAQAAAMMRPQCNAAVQQGGCPGFPVLAEPVNAGKK